ncbi:MAG TPA: methyltransferase domain-containing protein [Burkholderiales bacterium]|jgi:arsenite methyltransferase|nr:methyltransferase domain-containing protein [Burkholderiales bacterium]
MTTAQAVNRIELEAKVKEMYRYVADAPSGEFHFEMGRTLAERLGYRPAELDRVAPEAVESFAGVGFHFDLAAIRSGDTVLDLGSGSGMDSFIAALKTGPAGHVSGLDMTDAQLQKAERLRAAAGLEHVSFHKGYIEDVAFASETFDVVISNGVINLSADKARVFLEAARVLKPGGRLAISDIVTEKPLPEGVTCNATLWAACIGGAMQQDDYFQVITRAGLHLVQVRDNPQYQFLSQNAKNAAHKYGVKSVSLLAIKY